MSEIDPSIGIYVEETRELLGELERGLLDLEKDPGDMERVDACFRAMHTIKGGGAMFGFEEISRFTHDVETVLDRVRSGELPVTSELLTLTLAAKDHILALLEAPIPPGPELLAASDALLESFAAFLPHKGAAAAKAPVEATTGAQASDLACDTEEDVCYACEPQPGPPGIYWVRFRPSPLILHSGNDPARLLADLDSVGIVRTLRHGPMPDLDASDFNPEEVYGVFDMLIRTPCTPNTLRDVFIFVEDDSDITIEYIHQGNLRGDDLRDLLHALLGLDAAPTDAVLDALSRALANKLSSISAAKAKAEAGRAQAVRAENGKKRHGATTGSTTLRVDAARLDSVVSMAGELVILQSRLRQAVQARDIDAAAAVDEDLERLTDAMRDVALGLRMLPIGTVFSQFTRLLRDLSASLGKSVEFEALGGDTELDKTVIDRIKDPLIHLLRNSLDHGVESPSERQAAGKPEKGRITLSASHSGGNVVIAISDDGKGIDPVGIRNKAVEKGLIAPDSDLPEKAVFELIFAPGFSTAQKISDISGRGVGMDVVKRNIEALRGSVEVDSVLGQGTTVTIKLPLTLAIIDGFSVVVGRDSFIVPLVTLRGFQERFPAGDVRTVENMERMGELIPVVSLRKLFSVPGSQPGYERVVITEVEGDMVGFCVDKVVGRQQAVIKSLDDCYRHLKWISGTTINGDGSISLILDVPQLVRFVREQEDSRLHAVKASRTLAQ
ncbi:CheA signal transduction histidine kinase [Solidesulfovibrio fructosivorans JJ]]|uniref:Chemotaxis protein CheA n=1 Tax=Solidesulfovibrio fructosivorans JJ] TaxID=596151 RepID=E1K2E7_SOLFR|nr:chemotaxis protein CheA [Solidesulfovibrio fructosivorans]EFL49204.1 CheA signal transduction histidine kinase [Solidesulfovibrio fructosivorans JJ]]